MTTRLTTRHVAALLTRAKTYESELRFLYPNGAYRWTQAVCVPIRDAHGNVVRYVTCQIDVDDLKQAEALLAAEVKLLEMVARGEPLRARSGRSQPSCGRVMQRLFLQRSGRGARREALPESAPVPSLPDAWHDIFNGKTIDSSYDPCSLSVIEKAPVIASDLANDPGWQGSPWLPVMNALGFGSCCAMPILSASGEVSGVVAIYRSRACGPNPQGRRPHRPVHKDRGYRDRSQLRPTQPSRRANGNCAKPWRSSPRGSASARPPASPRTSAWIGIAGRTSSTVSSRSIRTRRRASTRSAPEFMRTTCQLFDAEMQRRLEGEGGDFNFRVVTPQGGVKYLRGVSQVIEHIEGRPIFMGVIQDITESKVAEEALNRTRSELAHVARVATLNAMTASIAHEVSQPLSGILTNANTCVRMLAADPPNLAGAAETARRTIRDANRATEVIRRLRAMFSTRRRDHGDGGSQRRGPRSDRPVDGRVATARRAPADGFRGRSASRQRRPRPAAASDPEPAAERRRRHGRGRGSAEDAAGRTGLRR